MSEPIVFLPGLLCTEALWGHQIGALSGEREMLVGDLTQDDNFPAMAKRLLDQAPSRFALAGLSMGGYLAMEIMRQAPDRVTRLALFSTSGDADDEEKKDRRAVTLKAAAEGKLASVSRLMLSTLVHPTREGVPSVGGVFLKMAEAVGPEAFAMQQKANMNRPENYDVLAKVKCPTLLVCGEDDVLTGPDVMKKMHEAMPHAAAVILDECGHLLPLEKKSAVTALLQYWLQVS